ncbi:hypothetical protein ACFL3H_07070 [Gemmatimonadota bacterium]
MRDCLQKALEEGVHGAPPEGRWHKSLHKALAWRIALEIKEAGYTPDEARGELREWALERCRPPVPPQAMDPHILSLVDSVYSTDGTGLLCKSTMFTGSTKHAKYAMFAIDDPLCFADETLCAFQEWERHHLNDLWKPVRDRYREGDWKQTLLNEYGPEGVFAHRMFIALCTIGRQKGLNPRQPIMAGTRAIAEEMNRSQKKSMMNAMGVSRVTHRLEEQGLITVTRPQYRRRGVANAYRVHPPAPQAHMLSTAG